MSTISYKDENGNWQKIPMVGSSSGGNVKIEVDDSLSETSINPVQNKVINQIILDIQKNINVNSQQIENVNSKISSTNDYIETTKNDINKEIDDLEKTILSMEDIKLIVSNELIRNIGGLILPDLNIKSWDEVVSYCSMNISNNTIVSVSNKANLTGELVIPNKITIIGEYAFDESNELTSLILLPGINTISKRAFQHCESLESVVLPSSITSIGEVAFGWCSSLKSIILPNSITSIEGYTFNRCEALTSVKIPSSVTSIGEEAFSGCTSLSSVIIPSTVKRIDNWAFSDVPHIEYHGTATGAPWGAKSIN